MSKLYIEIDSLILIFFFFIIYFNRLSKKSLKKFKKFPLFYVSNCSSNFKHLQSLKDGDLVSFACKGEIICFDKASDFNDFLLNDDFYLINCLRCISKNAKKR